MSRKRVLIVLSSLAGAFALYLLLGFFALPVLLKQQLHSQVEKRLGHKLAVGQIRTNPLKLTVEVSDLDLREPNDGRLLAFKRLFADFEARSLIDRTWTFAEILLEAPRFNGEIRQDGTLNFAALIEALRDREAKPEQPLPRVRIGRIVLSDGTIDLADLSAAADARLRIAPVDFQLAELSTLPSAKSPYKLTAKTRDGESLQWDGELSLNPLGSAGEIELGGWKSATFAPFLGQRVHIAPPTGELDATLIYRLGYSAGALSLALDRMGVKLRDFAVTPTGGSVPLGSVKGLTATAGRFDLTQRTLAFDRIELAGATLTTQRAADQGGNWEALVTPAREGPAPAGSVTGTSAETPSLPTTPSAGTPWRVSVGELALADTRLSHSDRHGTQPLDASIGPLTLALGLQAELNGATARLTLANIKATTGKLQLRSGAQGASLDDAAIDLGTVTVARSAEALELNTEPLKLLLSELVLEQGKDKLRIPRAELSTATVSLTQSTGGGSRLALDAVQVKTKEPSARLAGAKTDTLAIRAIAAVLKTLTATFNERPDVQAEGGQLTLEAATLRDPASGNEMGRLGLLEASGVRLALARQRLDVERIALREGRFNATVDERGQPSWAGLMAALGAPAQPPAGKPARPKSTASAPADRSAAWHANVKALDASNFSGEYTDRRSKPPTVVALDGVQLKARNLGTDRKIGTQVDLNGRIRDAGPFAANGEINLHTLESDLKLKLDDLDLTPAQPFLDPLARLKIVSGRASAEGRLRYGLTGAGADLVYEGSVGLTKIDVQEVDPNQPFLALRSGHAAALKLTIGPNRIEIPELRVDGLAGKLLIAEDQSVNLAKVLKRPPGGASEPAPSPTPASGAGAGEPFPIAVNRIRIDDSRLEFADLSLRPQFSTRMHELQGVINGIATARGTHASMELDARVDDYGSARIQGEMNLFAPRTFTAVDMRFRNLAMSALTPYSAKFAGYQIRSGTLSMDLQYRVKESTLIGDNKIVLDKLELGEKVESKDAINVPLELALALLRDSSGRIDIGLPVKGNLEDPEFSYGHLIWRAIGNLLTGIVTAPFRFIGQLFGGQTERLDSIEFEPGKARLQPPERQKLKAVADALQKRPQLSLTVKPTYATEADAAALRTLAARRDIALRAGLELTPDEDPGPIDTSNPAMQKAISASFIERFSAAEERDLRASSAGTTVEQAAQTDSKPERPANDTPYREMLRRLIDAAPLDDQALNTLGVRRGASIAQELREAGAIEASRLTVAAPALAEGDSLKVVATGLELGVVGGAPAPGNSPATPGQGAN